MISRVADPWKAPASRAAPARAEEPSTSTSSTRELPATAIAEQFPDVGEKVGQLALIK